MQVLQEDVRHDRTSAQAATLSPHDALRKLGSASGNPSFIWRCCGRAEGESERSSVGGPSVSPDTTVVPMRARRRGERLVLHGATSASSTTRATSTWWIAVPISSSAGAKTSTPPKWRNSSTAIRRYARRASLQGRRSLGPGACCLRRRRVGATAQLATELHRALPEQPSELQGPAEVHFVPELPRNAAGKVAGVRRRAARQ